MNILQINASYKPAYIYGGPTMSVSKLCEQLVKNGCAVQVFSTTANGPTELQVVSGIPQNVEGVFVRYFKRITKDHSHFSPQLLLTLWREVRSFDVVHIHAWWNLVSIFSCCIALLRKVPVILSPRGTLSDYSFTNRNIPIKKLFHTTAGRFLLNRCHLHTTSEREQETIERLIKPKSIFTIHNAVSLPVYIPIAVQDYRVMKLLFLSRIERKKGLELLFGALAELSIPYQLTIAGSGETTYIEKLKELSRQYRIHNNIDWVGFKSKDKFELIAQHHLLVLPSYDENFGNVVIESLCVGTAVLVSGAVGLAKYVTKNNLGWVCDTNVNSIKEQLHKIYHSQGMLAVIREFAPVIIVNEFNGDKLIGQYLKMYQQIVNPTLQLHG
ncbi:MAG: glycosyltransferase [Candidatus Pedobacter colombiensis]|uniref:Glycosyltransferase n=1 Tax=Candidatus Pedobacter colombiensis TaxID=3121371 RepID=A0AAJ5W9E5_9SPHI|nr:glycosyltransferase [Pedobacter sp.]WEK19693.1 MAG: glycosyltransferase [Pedobacter sp.]